MIIVCMTHGAIVADGVACHQAGDQACMLMPVAQAEPFYPQNYGGGRYADAPRNRGEDGRFDQSSLQPELKYRIGRDFIAHCYRWAWVANFIKMNVGPGATLFEAGCGTDLPMFRTLTMDHSSVQFYKPSRYLGADLNPLRYHPVVNGIEIKLLEGFNLVDREAELPAWDFDVIVSFEVLEHMGKEDGIRFLDMITRQARRSAQHSGRKCYVLFSTPANNGKVAKNHLYEWHREELERHWLERGMTIRQQFGMFADLRRLLPVLTPAEREVYNGLTRFHSPHTISAIFAVHHPEVASNVAWELEVGP